MPYADIEKERARGRQKYKKYKAKYLAKAGEYARANRDKINERNRKRRAYVPRTAAQRAERKRQQTKSWRAANSERFKSTKKAWVFKNKTRIAGYYRAYQKRHADKIRERVQRRKAVKMATMTAPIDYASILALACGVCGICLKPFDEKGIDFDHIRPLSKGGTHTADNIQAAHRSCNQKKGARYADS